MEWVDLRALPQPEPVDPRSGLPTVHSDWLFTNGGYDFIGTGFTPPVTALGNNRDIVYAGISGPRVQNGRLVTTGTSDIATVGDLKGKRVGVAHGSWQTTLVLFALDNAGLTWSDIEPVNTETHQGGPALLRGELDAWVGAYPGLTSVESAVELRTLVDTDGLFSHPSLWFTRRDFAEHNRTAFEAIIAALQESDTWITRNPRAAAQFFVDDVAAQGGTADLDAWEVALRSRPFGVRPLDEQFLDEQQRRGPARRQRAAPWRVRVHDAVLPWVSETIRATTPTH